MRPLLARFGTGSVAGGPLSLDGTVSLGEGGFPFHGDLVLQDVTVRDLPLLARVATLSSLEGVTRTLRGRGIAYRRVSARLAQRWPVLRVREAATTGGEPGLALDGTIDLATGALDLRGTLVPSYYGLNRAKLRVDLDDQRFIDVFFNARNQRTDLSLVAGRRRILGYDNLGGWHRHPAERTSPAARTDAASRPSFAVAGTSSTPWRPRCGRSPRRRRFGTASSQP